MVQCCLGILLLLEGLGSMKQGIWKGYDFCTESNVLSENIAALIAVCCLWLTQVAYAFIFVAPVTVSKPGQCFFVFIF